MPTFEYVHNEDSEIEVKEGDDGRYVERGHLARGLWMSFGVGIAIITGWFILQYDGSEGWLLTTFTPATIGALALAGVVAEGVLGDARADVVEEDGTYYLEMMTASRWYALAGAVAVLLTGVSMFAAIQAPGLAGSDGRRGGIVAIADLLPLGEFLLLSVALLFAYGILRVAARGRMPIQPKGS